MPHPHKTTTPPSKLPVLQRSRARDGQTPGDKQGWYHPPTLAVHLTTNRYPSTCTSPSCSASRPKQFKFFCLQHSSHRAPLGLLVANGASTRVLPSTHSAASQETQNTRQTPVDGANGSHQTDIAISTLSDRCLPLEQKNKPPNLYITVLFCGNGTD